ncbi:MAG: hypothetical protein JWN44_951 [Myxococcales bacterium]|nr:hypothetical protein [Myxococcales bacterium]
MRVVLALTFALAGCGLFGNGTTGSSGGGSAGSGGGGSSNAGANALHNLDVLNSYRAAAGVPSLAIDDQISAFSTTASMELKATNMAHGYFMQQGNSGELWNQGFCSGAAENQAPNWPVTGGDVDSVVDKILKAMMDEGPGGGHHDNILNRSMTRVGVGLLVDEYNRLWFTNDFSGRCP